MEHHVIFSYFVGEITHFLAAVTGKQLANEFGKIFYSVSTNFCLELIEPSAREVFIFIMVRDGLRLLRNLTNF